MFVLGSRAIGTQLTRKFAIWQVFRPRTSPEAIDLVSHLLEYTPAMRLGAIEGMVHKFFDELRQEGVRMPNGREFPRLFDFTREGGLSFALGL